MLKHLDNGGQCAKHRLPPVARTPRSLSAILRTPFAQLAASVQRLVVLTRQVRVVCIGQPTLICEDRRYITTRRTSALRSYHLPRIWVERVVSTRSRLQRVSPRSLSARLRSLTTRRVVYVDVVGKMSHVARRKTRIDVATREHEFLQKCRLGNRGFLLKCREIMSRKVATHVIIKS